MSGFIVDTEAEAVVQYGTLPAQIEHASVAFERRFTARRMAQNYLTCFEALLSNCAQKSFATRVGGVKNTFCHRILAFLVRGVLVERSAFLNEGAGDFGEAIIDRDVELQRLDGPRVLRINKPKPGKRLGGRGAKATKECQVITRKVAGDFSLKLSAVAK